MTAIHADRIHATRIQADRISARRIGEGDGPSVRTLLSIALQSTLVPGIATGSGTPTYTRSTVATVTDFEGLVKNVLSGEARFMGARRVSNLFSSSATLATQGVTVVVGRSYSISFSGTGTITLSGAATGSLAGTSGQRSAMNVVTATTTTLTCTVSGTVTNAQCEDVTGQANQNPSEYVSAGVLSAPYHGANVDGVKYFTTKNGNTVSSNIVTEATGAAIGASDYLADASGPFGYVSEGARTNLCTYSQDFTNAVWVATGVTKTGNAATAPDGTLTADSLTEDSGTSQHRVQYPISSTAVGHAFSVYVKKGAGSHDWVLIQQNATGGEAVCYFDIANGVVGTATRSTGEIVSVGGGWYRCSVLADTGITPTTYLKINIVTADISPPSFSGDGTSSIYVWGAQFEAGSFPSTYIPTTSAAVTRNAGSGSYASSSNITTANGVMVIEWTPPYTGMGTVALWGSYVDANNYTRIFHDGTNIVFRRRVSGVNYDATKALTYAAGTTYKIAARISDATGGDVFVAGVKGTNSSNTSALQLGANFSVGHDGNGANHSFAPIRNVKHYDTALTDVQVAAI